MWCNGDLLISGIPLASVGPMFIKNSLNFSAINLLSEVSFPFDSLNLVCTWGRLFLFMIRLIRDQDIFYIIIIFQQQVLIM